MFLGKLKKNSKKNSKKMISPVGARGILVAALLEVELAKVAIDEILVGTIAVRIEVGRNGFRAAEVREAEAHDAKGVGDTTAGVLVFRLFEVVSRGDHVIEQCRVLMHRFLVQFLLVECPAELVERELVELRHGASARDSGVGFLGVEESATGEEVFRAAKLHFVDMARIGMRGD